MHSTTRTTIRAGAADDHGAALGLAGTDGVCEVLREWIRTGSYDPTGKLPDEFTLVRELGVSRTRLRAALERLTEEGVLVRRRGQGTFVPTSRVSHRPHASGGFSAAARLMARSVEHRMLSSGTWAMDLISAADFGAAVGSPMHLIERLTMIDDEPLGYGTYVIRADLTPGMLAPELCRANLDLRVWLARSVTGELGHVDVLIEATTADPATAERLGCRAGSSLLRMSRHFFLADGRLLAYGSIAHRGDRFGYRAVREYLGDQETHQ